MIQENRPDYFYRISTLIPASKYETEAITLDQDFASGDIIQDKAEATNQYHLMTGVFNAGPLSPSEYGHVLYLVEVAAGVEQLHPITGEPDEVKASLEIEAEVLAMNKAFNELTGVWQYLHLKN